MGTLLDESDGAETIAMELCQSWTKMALLVVRCIYNIDHATDR